MKLFLSCFISFVLSNVVLCADDTNQIFLSAIASAFDDQHQIIPDTFESETDEDYTPQVNTSMGLIRGLELPEAYGFYHVPFGKSATDNMRFERSQPIERFIGGEFKATSIKTFSCYQPNQNCANNGNCEGLSEDCLVLNVHVPKSVDLTDSSAPPSDRLPVFVWIHGGALIQGTGTKSLLDGRFLSNVTDSIVVTFNYRLGALGFLAFEDDDDIICNQGLSDQQLALKWVYDHIAVFGGDSNRVTLAGGSAGAQSVMFHLMSEKSSPFFHRAILQSQPAVFQYPDAESALMVTEQLKANTNCTNGGIQCLRELDPYVLVEETTRIQAQNIPKGDLFGVIEPFRFVLDGKEFSKNPIQFVQSGVWFAEKPVIIGTNTDEMIYVPAYIPDILNISYNLFERFLVFILGEDIGKAVAQKYDEIADDDNKDYQFILGEIATDGFFICPSRAIARLASKLTHVYLYSFAHVMDQDSCEDSYSPSEICGYVFHSAENPFVFRTDPLIGYDFTADDVITANQLSYYWGNFMISGDPSSGNISDVGDFNEWPVYFSEQNWTNQVIYSPQGDLDFNYKQDICDFWDSTKYYVDLDEESTTSSSVKDGITTVANTEQTTSGTRGLHKRMFIYFFTFQLMCKILWHA